MATSTRVGWNIYNKLYYFSLLGAVINSNCSIVMVEEWVAIKQKIYGNKPDIRDVR
jgi:hypothetical protein